MTHAELVEQELTSKQKTSMAHTIKAVAYNWAINSNLEHINSVDVTQFTIDFNDGSIFSLRDGSHVEHGFYPMAQNKRA